MSDELTVKNPDAPKVKTVSARANLPTMHVRVYSPYQVYFDGLANTLSAVNETGNFDILPKHHNFLTLLIAGDIVIQTPDDTRTIKINRGFMHVKADRVVVFLDV